MGPTAVVVMGVAGSGKSTVGKLLASSLGWTYAEGDDFHSAANVAKMAAGDPLTDEDRAPWLAEIRNWMTASMMADRSCVVGCSALRRSYRDVLREAARNVPGAVVRFAYLSVDIDTLHRRLVARHGHYMHVDMLNSQLATLEPPTPDEHPITVVLDDSVSPDSAAQAIQRELVR
jgi:gluconokinase